MADEDLKAELERLKAENERLKSQRGRSVSLKGQGEGWRERSVIISRRRAHWKQTIG
jgi:hypothetical protein